MEQFIFENTTIFNEVFKLTPDENKKLVKFIIDQNLNTRGECFSKKIEKLQLKGGFKFESKLSSEWIK